MLSKILRSRTSVVAQRTFMRSGFSHPDPPPMTGYKFKRPYSLFEANMWYHDEVQPEFLLTYQDPWIHKNSTFFIMKQMASGLMHLVIFISAFMVVVFLSTTRLHPKEAYQSANFPFHAEYVQDRKNVHEDPKYKTDMIGIPIVKSKNLESNYGSKEFYATALSYRREMDQYNKDLKNYVENFRKRVIAEKFGSQKDAQNAHH